MATFRGGVVERAELEDWKEHRRQIGGRPEKRPERWHVRQIVLLQALGERYQAAREFHEADFDAWLRVLEMRLAEARLSKELLAESSPTESEMRQRYKQDQERFRRPKRWHLENIFLRFPEPASDDQKNDERRNAVRQRLERLRREILDGADFTAVAKRESDSQTRARGGRMGSVPLERLPPQLAKTVGSMVAGALSSVIETADGVTLLRCTGVVPGRPESFAVARETIDRELRRERFELRWSALRDSILAKAEPEYPLTHVPQDFDADGVLASFRGIEGRRSVTYRELDFYRRDRNLGPSPRNMSAMQLRQTLEDRIIVEGVHEQARRRGLLAEESHERRLRWEQRELQAELVRRGWIQQRIQSTQEAVIQAEFEQRRDQLVKPAEMHLQWLKTRIKEAEGRDFYRRSRRLGEQLASGQKTWKQVRQELEPRFSFEDLGWRSEKEVWMLGLNVDQAVKDLTPGSATALIQEGRWLHLIEMIERREARPMTFAEARPGVENSLVKRQRNQLRRQLEQQVLAELNLEMQP